MVVLMIPRQNQAAGKPTESRGLLGSLLFWTYALSAFLHFFVVAVAEIYLQSASFQQRRPVSKLSVTLPTDHLNIDVRKAAYLAQSRHYFRPLPPSPDSLNFMVNGAQYFSPHELDRRAEFFEGNAEFDVNTTLDSAVPTGSQRFLLFITADGTVENVVFSFESEFTLRAAEKMRYWRFLPGVKDGHPVSSFKLLDIVLEASIGFGE